jgi:hypothetical protein
MTGVPRGGRAAGYLLAALFFVLIFHRFWDRPIILRDGIFILAPAKIMVAEALARGKVLGWCPWHFLGLPSAADPLSGWYYPLNAVFLLLPAEPAYRVFVLIHYPLAAWFMFILLRGRGLSLNAAVAGAGIFALSGHMISHHSTVTMLAGAAWGPLAIHCMLRTRDGGLRFAAGAGAALAMQVLGGDPQAALLTALVIGLIGLGRLRGPERARALGAVAIAGVVSLALAADQLVPSAEYLALSERHSGVGGDPNALAYSFHPGRLVELIWPSPFWALGEIMLYWGTFAIDLPGTDIPLDPTAYLGLAAITLAGVGVARGRRGLRGAVGVGLGLSLVLALGSHTPVFGWFHRLPGLHFFRYPEKYMGWVAGFTAVGAALGLDWLERELAAWRRRLARPALGLLGLTAAVALAGAGAWPRVLGHYLDARAQPMQYTLAADNLLRGGAHLVGFNLGFGLLLLLAALRPRWRRAAGLAGALLLWADLAAANVPTMPAGPPGLFLFEPELTRAIRADGGPGLGQYRIFRQDRMFYDFNRRLPRMVHYQREAWWERATLVPNLNALDHLEGFSGYNPLQLAEGERLVSSQQLPPPWLLELFNVRYAVLRAGAEVDAPGRIERIYRDSEQDVSVWKFPRARPRAYWAPRAVAAADGREAEKLLRSMDLADTIIVTAAGPLPADDPGAGSWRPAEMLHYEEDRVEVECAAETAGWLVLSDRMYPGWEAYVDGAPAKLYRANVLARAVRLPAGRHRVEFRFESRSLRLGAAISAAAWAALLLGGAASIVRARRSGRR